MLIVLHKIFSLLLDGKRHLTLLRITLALKLGRSVLCYKFLIYANHLAWSLGKKVASYVCPFFIVLFSRTFVFNYD